MESTSKTLTAACYCKNVHFKITVPTDSLPLKVHMCHCSICRYTHGTLCCFHAPLPDNIQPEFIAPSSLNACTAYEHATSTKYFCSTCGCQIGDRGDDGEWVLSSAIFDANKDDTGIWRFNTHADPRSTPDGGLSALFSSVDGRKLQTVDFEPSQSTVVSDVSELRAQCYCGGVSFTISRPRDDFINSPASQGWIHPSDKSKWLASLDTCDDCRLVNGTHVVGWMFVPVDHILPSPAKDMIIGSSKSFRSSPDVLRTFCGTCGATVLYSCEERSTVVDVAVGLLRAPEGAMAEDWALWRAGRLAGLKDGLKYHEGFATALMEGLKEWGIPRGHPEDFIVP